MLELQNNQLAFSFPEVHPDAKCYIRFVRTLRIPDQRGQVSRLPPGLGSFPLREIASLKDKLSPEIVARGGIALPMYQAEAMWLQFSCSHVSEHGVPYPFAVKIATGKRSAVTGKEWVSFLRDGDYLMLPKQPWIDGFVDRDGTVRQFVAMPLGLGVTVEEQITGAAEFGGLQIEVFPMQVSEFFRHHPKLPPRPVPQPRRFTRSLGGNDDGLESFGPSASLESTSMLSTERGMKSARPVAAKPAVQSMGMAAGGSMKQEIYADTYGIRSWDLEHSSRTFVHLFSAASWQTLTGSLPPTKPPTRADYDREKFPWFDFYAEGPALPASPDLAKVKSVGEIAEETGTPIENMVKPGVSSGNW